MRTYTTRTKKKKKFTEPNDDHHLYYINIYQFFFLHFFSMIHIWNELEFKALLILRLLSLLISVFLLLILVYLCVDFEDGREYWYCHHAESYYTTFSIYNALYPQTIRICVNVFDRYLSVFIRNELKWTKLLSYTTHHAKKTNHRQYMHPQNYALWFWFIFSNINQFLDI